MASLTVSNVCCDALFVSALQRSDAVTADAVAAAISGAIRQYGRAGCTSRVAQEFGDHPEAASERMQWVQSLLASYLSAASEHVAGVAGLVA